MSPSMTPTPRLIGISFLLKQHFYALTTGGVMNAPSSPFFRTATGAIRSALIRIKMSLTKVKTISSRYKTVAKAKAKAVPCFMCINTARPMWYVIRVASSELRLTGANNRSVYLAKCIPSKKNRKWEKIAFGAPFGLLCMDLPSRNQCFMPRRVATGSKFQPLSLWLV